MANPQKENGFIPIANEIAEALSRINLSAYESRILWIIFRKTYGWGKKDDRIALSQFKTETNIPIPHICRTLKKLVNKRIITQIGKGYYVRYSFQKNYERWKLLPKQVTLPKQVIRITQTGNKLLPKQVIATITKDIKDTNTKDSKPKGFLSDEDFINTLKTKEVYKGIDIDRELDKMDSWLLVHPGRKKTRRFIVNWLNKIDKPVDIKKPEIKPDRPEPINEEEHKKVSALIHETAEKMKGK